MKKVFESLRKFINKLPRSILRIGLPLVLLLILVILAWNPIRVMNLQARTGNLIDAYIENYANPYRNFFTCQIPALTALPEDEGLKEALVLLNKAEHIRPKSSQTYLFMGKVYCLKGEFTEAITAFNTYSTFRQGNPLGELESAFAHYTATLVSNDMPDAEREMHQTTSRRILEAQGYSYEYFLDEGNAAFDRDAHAAAWYWYHLASLFQPLQEEAVQRVDFLDGLFIQ